MVKDTYNAREVFEMAIGIERQGRDFYQKASDCFDEPRLKSLLKGLAEMESEHEETFVSLMNEFVSDQDYAQDYDPDGVAASYLAAMTRGEVFSRDLVFYGTETIQEVLKKGIEAEKNSIIFYTGLKGVMPEDLDGGEVDRIIREEMKHIVVLTEMLASLEG